MNEYFILTDTNSRQYPFELTPEGLHVGSQVMRPGEQDLAQLARDLTENPAIQVSNRVFMTQHIVEAAVRSQ